MPEPRKQYTVRSDEDKTYDRARAKYEDKHGPLSNTEDIKDFEQSSGITYRAKQSLKGLPPGKVVGGGDRIVDAPKGDNQGFVQGSGLESINPSPVTRKASDSFFTK